jgi:hypothetical protein
MSATREAVDAATHTNDCAFSDNAVVVRRQSPQRVFLPRVPELVCRLQFIELKTRWPGHCSLALDMWRHQIHGGAGEAALVSSEER